MDTYEQVKSNFLSGKIKGCKAFFKANNYPVEEAYCELILGNINSAKKIFEKEQLNNIRAHWGLFLTRMIQDEIVNGPTYFEIRNFLETDLSIMITYCMGDYIEKIIRYADFMAHYNMECYKFIGRAFWANDLMPAAMFFLNKAREKMYNDPELHYMLGYIYYSKYKDIEKCKYELNTCLSILAEYNPAVKLLNILAQH